MSGGLSVTLVFLWLLDASRHLRVHQSQYVSICCLFFCCSSSNGSVMLWALQQVFAWLPQRALGSAKILTHKEDWWRGKLKLLVVVSWLSIDHLHTDSHFDILTPWMLLFELQHLSRFPIAKGSLVLTHLPCNRRIRLRLSRMLRCRHLLTNRSCSKRWRLGILSRGGLLFLSHWWRRWVCLWMRP